MAARPVWRGQIRLALVSIPVEIYPATKSGAQIAFHQVHEPSGKRDQYEKVVPGIGPVDRDEILKGYEVSKGDYVLLEPEEIESVKLESRKTLDLVQFVDMDDIDPMYFDKPYFVVPADDLAEEAFVVVREALKASQEGRHRPARHARPGICRRAEAVRARAWCWRRCAMPTRSTRRQSYFRDIGDAKPDADLLDMADDADRAKSPASSTPSEFHNRYVDALQGPDRREAARRRASRSSRTRTRRAAAQGLQRHRPDGGAEEEPRR